MLVVLMETYCNKVNIQKTQRDDFIQNITSFMETQEVLLLVSTVHWFVSDCSPLYT